MSYPAEKLPDPDPDPIPDPVEQPGYTSVNTWALSIISQRYNLPNLLRDVTPWIDPHGQLTERAQELLGSVKVTLEKGQVSAIELFDSVVKDGYAILEKKRESAQSLGSRALQFITGRFPGN